MLRAASIIFSPALSGSRRHALCISLGQTSQRNPLIPPLQRNSMPTWLTASFPRRKVFISSAPNCSSKQSFVTGQPSTLPFSVTGCESAPSPHHCREVPRCMQQLVQHWHSWRPLCREEAQAVAMRCKAHTVCRAALWFQQQCKHQALSNQPHCSRGRGGDAPRLQKQDCQMISGEYRTHHTHQAQFLPQESTRPPRSRTAPTLP